MPTITEILAAVTDAQAEEQVLADLKAVAPESNKWSFHKFSFPRTFLKLSSRLYSSFKQSLAVTVRSRLRKQASGDALNKVALGWFGLERELAGATVGTMLIEDTGGTPITFEIGELTAVDAATRLRFRNISGGTLASGGSLSLSFRGEKPGAAYNIASDSELQLLDFEEVPVPGVTITNPADPVTGTWITTQGVDQETDAALDARCGARWETPGCGNDAYYLRWIQRGVAATKYRAALPGVPEVTKVRVFQGDGSTAGIVKVVLATNAGEPTSDMVTAAEAIAKRKRPIGLRQFTVVGAGTSVQAVHATVYITGSVDAYLAALEQAMAAYQTSLSIGETVYVSRVDAMLWAPRNVQRVDLTRLGPSEPPLNQSIDTEHIAVIDISNVSVQAIPIGAVV
jgi:hypothetical protein